MSMNGIKSTESYKTETITKMSPTASRKDIAQISIVHNNRHRIDSKLRNTEHDIEHNLKVNCRENFNEYLYHSTLHGLKYVGDRTISRFER